MKRFLLFAGDRYYPSGGWHEFIGTFESIDEATQHVPAKALAKDEFGLPVDWAHIVDMQNHKIVKGFGNDLASHRGQTIGS